MSQSIRKFTPIRNASIKRDFKRLLAVIASAHETDFAEIERLAGKYGLYFDDGGAVREESAMKRRYNLMNNTKK